MIIADRPKVSIRAESAIRGILGGGELRELRGGRQSSVYLGQFNGNPVVVKLVEASFVDRAELRTRLAMLSALARHAEVVCAPVAIHDRFVHDLERDDGTLCYAAGYEWAAGDEPDVTDPDDAAAMGRELARLHRQLAELPPFNLPAMKAFRHRSGAVPSGLGPPQLLHGDVNSANIRLASGRARIFDFDDCGYGPVEFDLAQALYVVLFDALTGQEPGRYDAFRTNFLTAYGESAGVEHPEAVLNSLITERVLTLQSWLADLARAPAGIQNSSPEWRGTLHDFVDDYLRGSG